MKSEFSLIYNYFNKEIKDKTVSLGIGDDCAIVDLGGNRLAITTDTLNEKIHFFDFNDAMELGYKSLIVNISDLASMGAKPCYYTLSLSLKDDVSERQVASFAKGLHDLASTLNMTLIGGNTSKSDTNSITIEAFGLCESKNIMTRDGALVGDNIYVTGDLGGSSLYVEHRYQHLKLDDNTFAKARRSFYYPPERSSFAKDLANICKCCIDISDGLLGDLFHIIKRSSVALEIDLESLPVPDYFHVFEGKTLDDINFKVSDNKKEYFKKLVSYDEKELLKLFLYDLMATGGGDYELCFTLPQDKEQELYNIAQKHNVKITKIGKVTAPVYLDTNETYDNHQDNARYEGGLKVNLDLNKSLSVLYKGTKIKLTSLSYEHFKNSE